MNMNQEEVSAPIAEVKVSKGEVGDADTLEEGKGSGEGVLGLVPEKSRNANTDADDDDSDDGGEAKASASDKKSGVEFEDDVALTFPQRVSSQAPVICSETTIRNPSLLVMWVVAPAVSLGQEKPGENGEGGCSRLASKLPSSCYGDTLPTFLC